MLGPVVASRVVHLELNRLPHVDARLFHITSCGSRLDPYSESKELPGKIRLYPAINAEQLLRSNAEITATAATLPSRILVNHAFVSSLERLTRRAFKVEDA